MKELLAASTVSLSLGKRRIINSASFSISEGEFVGLIGPNGAGKSTLLKALAGALPIEEGAVDIIGADSKNLSITERARRVAYLPQARPVFWSVSARAIVTLGRYAYGSSLGENQSDAEAVDHSLQEAGASDLADRPAAELSGGELSRIHLARTLAGATPIILADEPVAALDPAHQLSVMELLRKKANQGKAVLAALHELPLAARYCTRLIVINEGRIVADGTPKTILTPDLLRDVFQVDADIETTGETIDLRLQPLPA